MLRLETKFTTGKEVTDPGRDDFEYYVSVTISNNYPLLNARI